jgi:hypothetical protein
MVEDVDKHDSIDAGLQARKIRSVKSLHGHPGWLPNQDINSFDTKIRTLVEKRSCQFSVTTADVQKTATGWDQCGENLRKTADTPAINVGFVDLAEHTHLRATPTILKKKLEKVISTPKVTETITAATRRTTTTGFIAPNPTRFHT